MSTCRLPALEEAAREVREEKTMGASWALYRLAKALIEEAEAGADICSCLEEVERLVEDASPTMVPPRWIPRLALEACRRGHSPAEAARGLLDYQSRAFQLLAEAARTALRGAHTVVTLSYSGTVERILHSLPASTRIVVAESRPGGEGAILASRLAGSRRQVLVVPDSALALHLEPGGTAVIFGADAVTGDGCVYNKVGSRLLALAAKSLGVPAYSAFDATKTLPEAGCRDLRVEEWTYSIEGWGTVRVPVFEAIEPAHLAGYITEHGILAPGSRSVKTLARRLVENVLA
ncbi:MAG: hypothetical protein F7C34_04640 [Desulfurococcales archaeon]|nr:hypothetical protein [Desulfurococcales archaeon]